MASVRAVSRVGGVELAEALRERGFGVTEFAGHGREGHVEGVEAVLLRRDLPSLFAEVDIWDPEALVTVEEPRVIYRGRMLQGNGNSARVRKKRGPGIGGMLGPRSYLRIRALRS